MATSITLRSVKGSALTHAEVDDNFSNLKATADAALPSATAATTYQPLDGDLTSIAGLSGTSGFLKKTAANTWSLDTSTYLDTTTAASTYQTQSGMSSYLTTSSASSTYQTLAGMTSYLLSSTATSTYVALAGSTMTGNLTFSGNSRKIIGDFNNATVANRLSFQTSTANAETVPYIIPNGTGNTAGIVAANASDPTNSSIIRMSVNGSTDTRINSDINGTGSYLPLTIYTGGSERMRIDNAGNVGIGGVASAGEKIRIAGTLGAISNTSYAIRTIATINPSVTTSSAYVNQSIPAISAGTLPTLVHFSSQQGTYTGTVTNQYGFNGDSSLVSAANNYGFFGNIAAGTSRTITTVDRTSNVVTITTSVAHGYTAGQSVTVAATTNTGVNGTFTIASVPTTTTFTYAQTAADIASGADTGTTVVVGRYNFYANGTAPNYFAGNVGIGTTNPTTLLNVVANTSTDAVRITQTGAGNALVVEDSANPDATPFVVTTDGNVLLGATSGTGNERLYVASDTSLGYLGSSAGSSGSPIRLRRSNGTVSSPTAVVAENTLGIFQIYGYDGTNYIEAARITSSVDATPGTNDMPGRLVFSTTADGASTPTERMRIDNQGQVGIGATSSAGRVLTIGKNMTGATSAFGVLEGSIVQSDVTAAAYYFSSFSATAATSFTLTSLNHYFAQQGTFGAGSTVTSQYGFRSGASLTGATNNYGFFSEIASGTGRWNFYAAGTAPNLFSGNVTIFGAGGLGYSTGSGGAVTQATSRTTGVTLDKTNGAITLVSAAGSATYQTFTVTNSTVAATDTIIINQKSGTDKYIIMVTNVSAGSFDVTFATTGGTTTEQPVFNFAVIKAVTA